jgi:putative ABC transport system permease protein
MLSVAGAVAGIGAGHLSLRVLPSIGAVNLPVDGAITMTQPVIWATAAVALATGLVTGLYPAIRAARPDASDALKDGRSGHAGGSHHRVRSLLVASQVALSMVLLVGAVLLITSFVNLRHQEPGFDGTHILTANVALPAARYPDATAQQRFRDRLLDLLRALPGARAATVGFGLPLTGVDTNAPFARGDGRVPPLNERPLGLTRSISPGYFHALSIPITRGRDFSPHDTAASAQVIIISESTARKLFGGVDPIGRPLFTGSTGGGIRCEIVGVVGDVRSVSLAQVNDVEFYRPLTQRPQPFQQIVVRTAGDPLQMLGELRRAVRAVDPELPLNQPRALSAVADASLGQRKLLMALLGAFAALALLLATIGIYSVVAYLVGQRTNEIGIRLALGAHTRDVLRLVAWEGLRPVAAGLACGLLGVVTAGRVIKSLLYGVSPADPATLAAATFTLGTVALAACLIPARRATRVDPLVALRHE